MLISTDTIWLGLLGNPLGHSLSPLMHNATLKYLGINALYLPFTVPGERIGDAVRAIPALNLRGVNVTIPFKEAVIPFLDELSPEAQACRAVNVIANQQGKLVGYNTDGQGFIAALQEAKAAVPENVLILGAGGAARALVFALAKEGAKTFYLLDREENRARELARALGSFYQGVEARPLLMSEDTFQQISAQAGMIVNCTPVGMSPHDDVSPVESLNEVRPGTVLADVIYHPLSTRLLQMGAARGLVTINGVAMFVHQGALTLKLLLGVEPPLEFMGEVVYNQLKQTGSNPY